MSITYYHTEKGSFKVYPTHIEKFNEEILAWEKFHGNHFAILDHRPFGRSLPGFNKASFFMERVSSCQSSSIALAPFKPALPPMVIGPALNPASSLSLRMLSLLKRIR